MKIATIHNSLNKIENNKVNPSFQCKKVLFNKLKESRDALING